MSKGDEAGMYKSGENETFDGYNIPVALAAKNYGERSAIYQAGIGTRNFTHRNCL